MSFFRLYLVTDRTRTAGRPLLQVVEAALQGGVDAVQLREKDLAARELYALASELSVLCRRQGARLLINDRIDVALAVGADGVHLPGGSFTPADARAVLGPQALIGASTHNLEQAQRAAAGGADFIVFGPIFDTPAKRQYGAPVGLQALGVVTEKVTLPVLAIGGIMGERVESVRQHRVYGVAVISAILEADDPRAAALALRAALAG
ncbi:MAG TPA: thiamine phosphate synthase [Candidatus Acidoferrales bacterium]|nr:thiamine phosphate synthase [Candidatus Acidoferrales bacterium]